LDAGTSVASNLDEAHAGQSRKDFVHKNAISLKEVRESNYWLRLILNTYEFESAVTAGISELEKEANEIARIIGKIIVNTKNKP
jgi:four helix bundle protein